jgi:hypothetical protein
LEPVLAGRGGGGAGPFLVEEVVLAVEAELRRLKVEVLDEESGLVETGGTKIFSFEPSEELLPCFDSSKMVVRLVEWSGSVKEVVCKLSEFLLKGKLVDWDWCRCCSLCECGSVWLVLAANSFDSC